MQESFEGLAAVGGYSFRLRTEVLPRAFRPEEKTRADSIDPLVALRPRVVLKV